MTTRTAPTAVGARACAGTTAFAAALSLAALACEADAPVAGNQADVVTDTIGDTVVVRTLAGSVWGADAALEPEVSIGELDGPDEYLFGWVSAIAVDDDHSVYVLDGQAQEILEYDALGNYVRTVARPGEGPGELTRAYQSVDKIPPAFDRRCIRPGRFASPFHNVKTALHCVMCSVHSALPKLRSALLLSPIAPLLALCRALPARRLAALGARGALSTDCAGWPCCPMAVSSSRTR